MSTPRFRVPPGWEQPPRGYVPGPNWKPQPDWPAAPPDWEFWVDDAGFPVAPPADGWVPRQGESAPAAGPQPGPTFAPSVRASSPSTDVPSHDVSGAAEGSGSVGSPSAAPGVSGAATVPVTSSAGSSAAPQPKSRRRSLLWLVVIAAAVLLLLIPLSIGISALRPEPTLSADELKALYPTLRIAGHPAAKAKVESTHGEQGSTTVDCLDPMLNSRTFATHVFHADLPGTAGADALNTFRFASTADAERRYSAMTSRLDGCRGTYGHFSRQEFSLPFEKPAFTRFTIESSYGRETITFVRWGNTVSNYFCTSHCPSGRQVADDIQRQFHHR